MCSGWLKILPANDLFINLIFLKYIYVYVYVCVCVSSWCNGYCKRNNPLYSTKHVLIYIYIYIYIYINEIRLSIICHKIQPTNIHVISICTPTYMNIYIYIYIYIHTHTHAYHIYTYIYTYTK